MGELTSFVYLLVESDDACDAQLLEDRGVVLRGKCSPAVRISLGFGRSTESEELAGNNPVEVAMLHLLIVFVLLEVEVLVVVPAQLHAVLKALQAVVNGAFVCANTHCGVSVGFEAVFVWLEEFPGFSGCLSQYDHHKGSHEEGSIGLLVLIQRCVMVDFV